MLKRLKFSISFLTLAIICSSSIYGQDATIKIESGLLNKLIQQTDTHLLLKSESGNIYALDSKRNTLYPSGYVAPNNEVFFVYEVSYLKQLLENNNSKALTATVEIVLQMRDDTPICPPHCP